MIPFAQYCSRTRENTIVQEDNAPAHNHSNQARVYNLHNVARLLWPGNSPDLNAIEKAWPWLKRVTTARGCPKTKRELKRSWERAWKQLPQETIQVWIEGIVHNIKEVIRLEGGNEYKEGRNSKRSYKGQRIKGVLSPHTYLNAQLSASEAGASEVDEDVWIDEE